MAKKPSERGPISAALARPNNGGARYSTRPDAKARGPIPDLAAKQRALTTAIRRHGVKLSLSQRDALREALEETAAALEAIEKPIIL
jgi:hypothetical protein